MEDQLAGGGDDHIQLIKSIIDTLLVAEVDLDELDSRLLVKYGLECVAHLLFCALDEHAS
jgi:DNA-binding MltR family transcriptional regulator